MSRTHRHRAPTSAAPGNDAPRPRLALYSHDALGLGHIRRNLAIAHAAARTTRPDTLLLTGSPHVAAAHRPRGCDIVALPALGKRSDGTYAARHLSLERDELVSLRSSILEAALGGFAPDLLIVDKHPRGFSGELEAALTSLRAAGTRIVLGLRDVLDDPVVAAAQWERDRSASALEQWYDDIWVYGQREIHDPLDRLTLPAKRTPSITFTGYLSHGRGAPSSRQRPPVAQPYVLATVGGGSDGLSLAEAFAQARYPTGHRGLLITGPQMPPPHRRRITDLARHRDDLEIQEYVEDADALLAGAAAVVGMGGYNTVCEALSHRCALLVVPRVAPRTEQLIRAEALARAGHLDMLHPRHLTPTALTHWLDQAVTPSTEPSPADHSHTTQAIDLDGLDRVAALIERHTTAKESRDVSVVA